MKTAQSSFYFLVLARPSPFLFIPYTMDGFVLPPVEALGGTLTLDELRVRRTSFLRGGQIGQRVHPRSPPSPSSCLTHIQELLVDLLEHHLNARQHAGGRDATAHQPAAQHRHSLDRSRAQARRVGHACGGAKKQRSAVHARRKPSASSLQINTTCPSPAAAASHTTHPHHPHHPHHPAPPHPAPPHP